MDEINVSQNSRHPIIVVLISSFVAGGHEQQVYHLINDLILRAEVTVVCPSEQIKKVFEMLPCSVVLEDFLKEGKFWKQLWYAQSAAKLLRKYVQNVDKVVISGGSIVATICPVYACKLVNSKLECISYVPTYTDRSITHGLVGKLYNCIIDMIGHKPDAYCTINKIQAFIFKRKFKKRVIILPNIIRDVSPPAQSFGKRLVYVGRFDDESKDLTSLLLMLDCPENPYNEMLMIGTGPAENSLKEIANQSRYIHVTFLPWLDPELMDKRIGLDDCLILNSRWEGEPLVIREFSARKLPCIAKEIDGVRGIVPKRFRFSNKFELLKIVREVFETSNNASNFRPYSTYSRRDDAIQKLLLKK